jgi:CheY-like chemotaxis protein
MVTMLIVEDEALICEMAREMIQDWGYEVLSASDVDEALVLLRSPHRIDALFTDINLRNAVFGGCDLAHLAIKLRPTLRVLYTTGNSVTVELRSRFVKGAECLRKPYVERQLKSYVENLFAV